MAKAKQYKLFAYAGPVLNMKDVVIRGMARKAVQKQHL